MNRFVSSVLFDEIMAPSGREIRAGMPPSQSAARSARREDSWPISFPPPARSFDPHLAWLSPRGDCIFCYFSDAFAYADRIDNDLTVFRSLETKEPAGFKIKNVERMLEEGSVRLSAPDLAVEVQAFLLASLLRNPNTKVEVYSVLIGAWMRQAGNTEPPKITLPRPQQRCPA
jgi:hypothetical protein